MRVEVLGNYGNILALPEQVSDYRFTTTRNVCRKQVHKLTSYRRLMNVKCWIARLHHAIDCLQRISRRDMIRRDALF